MTTDSLEIDIDKIVRKQAGKKAKWIPRWLTKWLEGFIHQDFINNYLRQGREGVDFCEGVIEALGVDITVEGLDNVPFEGPAMTFVSNHPLGAIDGVALGAIVGRASGGRVKYLVRELLMNLKGLAPLCIAVNKFGAQSRDFPQQVEEAFNSENHIIMFPAGLCSRLIDGEVHDIPWSKAFLSKSIKAKRDIVPVHFIGENSPRFYRIARWCKRLGLKFNLAMTLLPDEMYRSRGNHYTVRFGKPIPYTVFDKQRSTKEWALWVEDEVYKL